MPSSREMSSKLRSRRRWGKARATVIALAGIAAAWLVLKVMIRLPERGRPAESVQLDPAADTRLRRALAPLVAAHPGKSGIHPLTDGHDAFAARALLCETAERTLDIQYYIWHHDTSGELLFVAIQSAADRGVRVRLLLDDNNTGGLDAVLAALDLHPNIEVRLFNPFNRRSRWLGYIVDFARVNRRMHNKSFTADNQVTIVGGRNVADEYFGVSPDRTFVDLDVLAIGPVVQEVSRDFDRYWASESSYPAERILPSLDIKELGAVREELAANRRSAAAGPYLRAIAERPIMRELTSGTLEFEWAATRMLSDDPAKVANRAKEASLLWPRMREALGPPRTSLGLVSPYFVPTKTGVEVFSDLTNQGVRVRVLTNSLEATDILVVHAGYARRRRALLAAGVELFEMKREFAGRPIRGDGPFGSSSSSLHAKTFSVDRQRVFVGSFNFDPRSARLNTELGLVIESEALAQKIAEDLEREMPARAYRVRLNENGSLEWVEEAGDGTNVVHRSEPGTSFGRRLLVTVISWLPIEWLL